MSRARKSGNLVSWAPAIRTSARMSALWMLAVQMLLFSWGCPRSNTLGQSSGIVRPAPTKVDPGHGGVLRVRLASSLTHINPLLSTDVWVWRIAMGMVLEPLSRIDLKTGAVKGVLLSSFKERQNDKKEVVGITLTLKRDIRWHDGKPFTSKDVAYSLRENMRYKNAMQMLPEARILFQVMEKVEIVSDHIVEIKFKRPFTQVMELLSAIPMLPAHRYESCPSIDLCEGSNQELIGTGPFKVIQWWPGEKLVLVGNMDHRGPKPLPERVEFVFIPSLDEAMKRMKDERLEMLADLSTEEWNKARKVLLGGGSSRDFRVARTVLPATAVLYFNWVKVELRDPRVRRAVALTLNKSRLAQSVFGGKAELLEHPVYLESYQYKLIPLPRWRQDLAAARRLLDQAGWKMGKDGYRRKLGQILTLSTVLPDLALSSIAFFRSSVAEFKKVGIKIEVDVVPFSQYLMTLRNVKYHMRVIVSTQSSGWTNLYLGFHSSMRGFGGNYGQVQDPRIDTLLDQMQKEKSADKRRDLEKKVLGRIRKITAVVPLYAPQITAIVSSRVKNLVPGRLWWDLGAVRVK